MADYDEKIVLETELDTSDVKAKISQLEKYIDKMQKTPLSLISNAEMSKLKNARKELKDLQSVFQRMNSANQKYKNISIFEEFGTVSDVQEEIANVKTQLEELGVEWDSTANPERQRILNNELVVTRSYLEDLQKLLTRVPETIAMPEKIVEDTIPKIQELASTISQITPEVSDDLKDNTLLYLMNNPTDVERFRTELEATEKEIEELRKASSEATTEEDIAKINGELNRTLEYLQDLNELNNSMFNGMGNRKLFNFSPAETRLDTRDISAAILELKKNINKLNSKKSSGIIKDEELANLKEYSKKLDELKEKRKQLNIIAASKYQLEEYTNKQPENTSAEYYESQIERAVEQANKLRDVLNNIDPKSELYSKVDKMIESWVNHVLLMNHELHTTQEEVKNIDIPDKGFSSSLYGNETKNIKAVEKEKESREEATEALKEYMRQLDRYAYQIREVGIATESLDNDEGLEKYFKIKELKKEAAELYDLYYRAAKIASPKATDSYIEQTFQKALELRGLLEDIHEIVWETKPPTFIDLSDIIMMANTAKDILEPMMGGLKKTFSSLFKTVKKGLSWVLKNMKKFISQLGKTSTASGLTFKKLIGGILGARTAYFAIRKATAAYLATNEELSNKLSAVWNAFGQLLAPAIEYVINLLMKLFNILSMIIKAFTGINLVAKANAAALKNQSGAADKAKNSLAGFDDLDVLNPDDGSGGSSSGGFSPIEEFDVNLDGLGGDLAKKINSILGEIDWEGIEEKVKAVIKKVATQINDFVDNLNWQLLGETIAKGFNTAVTWASTFFTEVNWARLGAGIGTGIMNFVTNFDWASAGQAVHDMLQGLLDLILATLYNMDFDLIGKKLSEFFTNINTSELLTELGEICEEIFHGIGTILGEIFSSYFGPYIEKYGGDIVLGMLAGIWDAIKGIAKWIYDHIFKPFIDGFKKAFGINSPSTVMEEQGGFIMEGLLKGLQNLWEKFKEWFQKLKDKAVEIVTNMKDKIIEKWNETKNKSKEIWENIKTAVTEKIDTLKTKALFIASVIKDKLTTIWNTLRDKTSAAFSAMKTAVVDTFTKIWTGIKNPINSILNGIEKMANGVITGINKMIGALNGLSFDIPWWVPLYGGNSFRLNIPTIPSVTIPRLAQGAVIPPNKEFLAVLGDQRRGTNIEAPLETIKQAFADVVGNMQVENTGYSEMVLDGQTFARLIVPYVISELERRNYNVSVLEG